MYYIIINHNAQSRFVSSLFLVFIAVLFINRIMCLHVAILLCSMGYNKSLVMVISMYIFL